MTTNVCSEQEEEEEDWELDEDEQTYAADAKTTIVAFVLFCCLSVILIVVFI